MHDCLDQFSTIGAINLHASLALRRLLDNLQRASQNATTLVVAIAQTPVDAQSHMRYQRHQGNMGLQGNAP